MAKRGRPRGVPAQKPRRGSATNRIIARFDRNQDTSTRDLARSCRCSQKLVIEALNRWRPEWRRRFWQAGEDE